MHEHAARRALGLLGPTLLTACLAETIPSGSGAGDAPPVAILDARPSHGAPPLEVRFDGRRSADAEGAIAAFAWDFGDGATASTPTAVHVYPRAGRYEARLTVTDAAGQTATAGQTITATTGALPRPPIARFTATPEVGEAPLTVTLDASASEDPDDDIVLHAWTLGDGRRLTGPRVSASYRNVGAYEVTLTVVDAAGLSSEASTMVRATTEGGIPPDARFTATPLVGPAPLEVAFDASASLAREGTIAEYSWDFGDRDFGRGETVVHTYASAGAYRARLTVGNSGGNRDTAERRIVARGPVGLPFTDDYASDRGWLVVDDGNREGPSGWRLDGGALLQTSNINDGNGAIDAIAKLGSHVHYGDPSWTDVSVEVRFETDDDDAVGVLARYTGREAYYRFSVDRQLGYARLVARDAGGFTLLAEDLDHPGYAAGAPTRLGLTVRGDRLVATVDGVPVLSATDARHASGEVGLYVWGTTNVRFDDLVVTATVSN